MSRRKEGERSKLHARPGQYVLANRMGAMVAVEKTPAVVELGIGKKTKERVRILYTSEAAKAKKFGSDQAAVEFREEFGIGREFGPAHVDRRSLQI